MRLFCKQVSPAGDGPDAPVIAEECRHPKLVLTPIMPLESKVGDDVGQRVSGFERPRVTSSALASVREAQSFRASRSISILRMVKSRLPSSAAPNPLIWKPGTSAATSQNISALTTNRNR